MGSIVPEVSKFRTSTLLVYSAHVRGYDQVMTLLVDSGASQNFVKLAALRKRPAMFESLCQDGKREEATVRLANGALVKSEGVQVELAFSFSDFSCKEKFTVLGMESPYDLILGMPWLAKYQPWIDWRTRTVANSTQDTGKDVLLREAYATDVVSNTVEGALTGCQTSPIPTQLVETEVVNRTMTSSHASECPAQSREPVAVDGELTRSHASHKPAQCQEPGAVGRGALARSATTPASQKRVVVTRKTSTRQIRTIKGTSKRVTFGSVSNEEDGPSNEVFEAVKDEIAEASSVEVLRQVFKSAEEIVNLPEMSWDLFLAELKEGKIHEIVAPVPEENLVDCCSSSTMDESVLETDKKKRYAAQGWDALRDSPFFEVLWKHRDVFPEEVPSRLPADRGIGHEIDLEPGTKYCVTRQWPLPKEQVDYIDEFFDKRAKAGHVRESKSPHCSPTFCVRKATGGWRVVHAYNKLNTATIPAQTPIPRKDVLLNSMGKSTIFSALDLKDGYYQVLMRESDVAKTAVSTPSGMLWEWLVMPQGLKNAPATFNRVVAHVMRQHRAYAPHYFDDVFVHSRAEDGLSAIESHKRHLDAVLQTLKDAQLYVNLQKCVIGVPEIPVLGCIVGTHGVRADPDKVKSVKEWPIPRHVKDLRQFLGLANYLHKYSKNYAEQTKPLSDLLKKDTEWVWLKEQEDAFTSVKQSLVEAPVLALPDADKPFSVVCDASNFAIGSALMQKDDDGVDRVISYQSRLLKAAELNYPVHDKELLSIKYALVKFRVHLLGTEPFVVYTDHASLRTAINSPHLSPRMARWLTFFSEFNFKVEYKPGKSNVLADALSRRPDFEVRHQESVSSAKAQFQPSTLAAMKAYHVTSSLASEIKESYSQDDHCRLLLDHFGGRKVSLPSHLKAKLNRFSYSDGLLWHQLSPCDPLRIYVPHDTDLKLMILHELHDAPSSGHLGREKTFLRVSEEFWWPHLYRWVANYIRSCEQCQRIKPAPSSSAPLKPLPIPTNCWKSVSLDFMFGMPPDHKGRTGLVVFVDRLSKMVHLAPCKTSITGKEAALLFLDHVYRLHGMPESIVSDRDPRFTSGFWRHVFELLGSKLHMSTADHPQTDGQTERANRVVADVLRTIATPKEWSKQLPFVEFAINNSVHASTGETPFYINGLRHPRTPVSFVRSPSLSGGGPLTMLGAKEGHSFVNMTMTHEGIISKTETCPSDPASLAVVNKTTPYDRPLGGIIGEFDAKSVSEAQRFVDERLAITRKVRDAMASAQDKQKEYADRNGRKNNERFRVGEKVLLSTATLPKNAISVLPGGTTKLLPRFIGPFTVVEEVGDLNYRLTLPPYMKTHPVFYVGRLKRYVDPNEVTYPHLAKETDGDADCESSVVRVRGTVKAKSYQTDSSLHEQDSESEGHHASNADPSALSSRKGPSESSGVHNPDEPSLGHQRDPRSVVRLDSRDPQYVVQQHATERTKVRQPRLGGRDRRSYRAPPALMDAGGNQRFLVGRLLAHRSVTQGYQILVQWKGYPKSFDSWEPIDTLRIDVPGLVAAYEKEHQLRPLR